VKAGTEDAIIPLTEPPSLDMEPEEIVDFLGKPAPPLHVDHWYHVENLDPEHKGKIRMIRFIGKDRSLVHFAGTAKLMQELQDEFAGQDVESILVHGTWPKEEIDEILAAMHPDLTAPLVIEPEEGAMSEPSACKYGSPS